MPPFEETEPHYREFCPRCGVPRPLQAITDTVTEINERGQPVQVSVLNLHCTICHSFVRSEHRTLPPPKEEKP